MAQLYSSEEVNVWHRAAPKITAMDSSDVGVSDGHSRCPFSIFWGMLFDLKVPCMSHDAGFQWIS
jgi:hypothetical protein